MREPADRDPLLLPGSRGGRQAVRRLRESFVERWLGAWSSHPRMAERRVTAVRRIGVAVVSGFAAFAAWRVYQAWTAGQSASAIGDFINAFSQGLTQRRWMLVALAFSLAATLTAGLTVRASFARGTAAPARSPAMLKWSVVALSCIAVAVAIAVAWLSGSSKLSAGARWWVLVGAMSPLSLIIFWFGLFPRDVAPAAGDEDPDRLSRTFSLWGALRSSFTPVLLAASSLLVSPDVARPVSGAIVKFAMGFSGAPVIGKLMAPFTKPIASILGTTIFQFVGMGCAATIATLAIARVTDEVRMAARGRVAQPPGSSLIGSIARGFGALGFGLYRLATGPVRWVISGVQRRLAPVSEGAGAPGRPPSGSGPELAAHLQHLLKSSVDPKFQVRWAPAASRPGDEDVASVRHPHDDLDWLFGGRRPTSDQVAILEAFEDRWREHSVAVERGEFGVDRQSHADLFVEASVDRKVLSSTLRACGLFGCVARGQRVLFLVEDDEQRLAQVAELTASLVQLRFEALFRVGTLDPAEVAHWCPMATGGAGTEVGGEPPDIVVATPGDYDRALLSGTFDSVQMRAFLLSIEVVVIDGLQRLTKRDAWLLHLPFLLDKHRLLLRNENRAMQLIIGSVPISDEWSRSSAPASICRERIAIRLFGGDGRVAGHFIALRPAFEPRPATVTIAGPRPVLPSAFRVALAELCAGLPDGGVAVLHGGPANDVEDGLADALRDDVSSSGAEDASAESDGGGDKPSAVPSGAGPGSDGVMEPRRVSLQSIIQMDRREFSSIRFIVLDPSTKAIERRKLRTWIGGRADPVIVEFVSDASRPDVSPPERPASSLPVFVSAGAPAMFLPHLRSAVPAMRSDAPTRREDFARFGLSSDEERWRSHAGSMSPVLMNEGWFLQTDGAVTSFASPVDSQLAWPAVFVRRDEAVRWGEVRPEAPPDEGLCLVRERDRLELAHDSGHVDRRRFARWWNARELDLGTTDLFRMSKLVLSTNRQEYRPMLLRSVDGSTQIEAEPRALEGDDFVYPKTFTRIELPQDMGIDGPYAVRGARAFLFRVRETATPIRTVETIVGLSAPTGREIATQHVSFSVHASVTLVVLGGDLPRDGSSVPDWIRASYEGSWTTMRRERRGPREVWPLLSHAVRVAIERCAPDLLRFARVFAFRPPFGHAGASLLVAETASTAGSAVDALRTILDDGDLRRTFLAALREAIMGAPARIPCVGPAESAEQAAQSKSDALQVISEIESAGEGGRSVRPADDEILGRVTTAEPGAPPHSGVLLAPGTELFPEGDFIRWSDGLLCATPGGAVELGVILPFDADAVRSATESFGWRMSDPIDDLDALRSRCVRLVGTRTIGPDYAAMVARSVADLGAVAEQLLEIADRAGLSSTRDRLRVFAGFVQTTTYERQRVGGIADGAERFGVQMPLETAFSRAGDCDSSALLLVALLRAGRIAPAGLMLVETEDAGHAMAAVAIPPSQGDHLVKTSSGELVLIECTDLHPIGRCAPEYLGRHVRVVAFG